MQRLGTESDGAELLAPVLVGALAIALQHQPAVAGDEHAVQAAEQTRADAGIESVRQIGDETDILGARGRPGFGGGGVDRRQHGAGSGSEQDGTTGNRSIHRGLLPHRSMASTTNEARVRAWIQPALCYLKATPAYGESATAMSAAKGVT